MRDRLLRLNQRLPSKLHALLDIALEDVAKTERRPDVRIDMGMWHEGIIRSPQPRRVCKACAAGSVIIQRSDIPLWETVEPDNFIAHDRRRLFAINDLRLGFASDAWWILHEPDYTVPHDRLVPQAVEDLNRIIPYYRTGRDNADWWEAMMEFHMDLRKAGV